jgi:hypothetical protein
MRKLATISGPAEQLAEVCNIDAPHAKRVKRICDICNRKIITI